AGADDAGVEDLPAVETSIITFRRGDEAPPLVMDEGPRVFDEGPDGDAQATTLNAPDGDAQPVTSGAQATTSGTRATTSNAPNEFVAAARALGLRVDLVGERFRFDPRALRALREAVKRRAPDLLLTHHVKSHFLARASGLPRTLPWVAYHHGYTATDRKMLAYNRLDGWSLPAARRVVTVCEAFARELETKRGVAREKIFVQHNSINAGREVGEDEVRRLKERLGVSDGERVVLTVGRLSREKAQADLLRAFARLARENSEVRARLVLVGEGPERAALERLAAELGIGGRVVFAGQTSDVAPFYAAADLFALPSHSEGSPYALLEAMAAGVPVVATRVGGVPEIVSDGESALVVAPRDDEALAGALARLLSDESLARALAASASALASTRHAPETFLRSLTQFYRGVVADARSLKSSGH
ncbi:MAG: glycosyltransferase, partial [Acidobacteriota bacterium]|nr:glycosyltransferase [Acidobacteriota bacterium]